MKFIIFRSKDRESVTLSVVHSLIFLHKFYYQNYLNDLKSFKSWNLKTEDYLKS